MKQRHQGIVTNTELPFNIRRIYWGGGGVHCFPPKSSRLCRLQLNDVLKEVFVQRTKVFIGWRHQRILSPSDFIFIYLLCYLGKEHEITGNCGLGLRVNSKLHFMINFQLVIFITLSEHHKRIIGKVRVI